MVCTGTGFTYSGTDVTGGTLSMVKILNGAGQTVLAIDTIPPGTLASDLAQLASSVAGWSDGAGGGTSPDGPLVWSQLLSGNDTINGTAGNDVYNTLAGDDWVIGGIGNDTINAASAGTASTTATPASKKAWPRSAASPSTWRREP